MGKMSKASRSPPPQQSRIGVLTSAEIRDLGIIPNGEDKYYKAASYDLRLGNEVLFPKIDGNRSTENLICDADGKKLLKIPPYGSVIVTTRESVRLPPDVVGRFNLRIKIALRGLFVQMGTQVEPGYFGILSALVHNVSSSPVQINLDSEAFFTIEFFFIGKNATDQTVAEPYLNLNGWLGTPKTFVKGMLADIVNSTTQKSEQALEDAKLALDKAKAAQQQAEKTTAVRIFVAGILISLMTSALIPFFIAWTSTKFAPTPQAIQTTIDESFEDILRVKLPVAVAAEYEKSNQSSNSQIAELQKKISQLQSQLEKLIRSMPPQPGSAPKPDIPQ